MNQSNVHKYDILNNVHMGQAIKSDFTGMIESLSADLIYYSFNDTTKVFTSYTMSGFFSTDENVSEEALIVKSKGVILIPSIFFVDNLIIPSIKDYIIISGRDYQLLGQPLYYARNNQMVGVIRESIVCALSVAEKSAMTRASKL